VTDLVLEDVSFVYPGGTRALDGIDLAIAAGESVAVIGQNGSGKSTLVRHLDGLLRPTAGRVLHDGDDVASVPVAQLARRVGIVFQNPDRQIFSGTVRAEVGFGPRILGRSRDETAAAVAAALAATGLADLADTNPYDLGFSRRKLLAMASVLAMSTPVLVLDEPTTGQDLRGVHRVIDVVRSAAAEGRTVIAISHDMRFVAETFERIVVMADGRIVLDGSPDLVFAQPNWSILASTSVQPTLTARAGAKLGLGSTPTEATFVAALAGHRGRADVQGRSPGSHA
jgi:energy-coupling factor transport system ATP-binding protein